MNDLLASLSTANFVDAVIAITLLEIAALALWPRLRRGIDVGALAPSLVSGLLLMLALRAAVGGAGVVWIVLAVALSGVAHLWDLRRRSRPGSVPAESPRAAAVPLSTR